MVRILTPALLFALFPALALAHTGHVEGGSAFAAGIAHPLGGADHLLAMVAVGLWAAQAGGTARWAAPAAFVAAMLGGAALGAAGVALPAVEPAILASVVILGAAAAIAARPPLAPALALVALFGLAHGAAHGAEGPAAGIVAYMAGFALATAALHGIGLGFGLWAARGARVAGAATVAAGLALAVAG